MNRRALSIALLMLVLVFPLSAQMRQRASLPPAGMPGTDSLAGMAMAPAMVSGTVTSVAGTIITITGGVKIDASQAKIVGDDGADATLASITPGVLVVVGPKTNDVAAGAPIPATLIAIHHTADLTITGTVQTVDAVARSFTILGQTLFVTNDTSFGGMRVGVPTTFADIAAGTIVHAEASASAGKLLATEVQIMAPVSLPVTYIHGTVKTISSTQWILTTEKGDVTVTVNAQTKIVGDPKAGDTVDVIATRDSSGSSLALSIVKHQAAPPPTTIVTLRGQVKSIAETAWVITTDGGDKQVGVTAKTIITPGLKAGDRVIVIAENATAGLVAISITRSMM